MGGLKTYCSVPDEIEDREVIPLIQAKPRYALFTSETPLARKSSIFGLVNSKQNLDGNYIQIFIGSPISKEGINLYDFKCFDNMNPWWNEIETLQAEGRIFRATGFVFTTERERKLAMERGDNPDDIRIEIDSLSHCSTTGNSIGTVDEKMYKISEEKNIKIHKFIRMMKQCAFDCITHYERNVRDSDVDGSIECDYQSCNYSCINKKPDKYIEVYNSLFAKKKVFETTQSIIKLFSTRFLMTLNEIINLTGTSKLYTILALREIIEENVRIINRYGIVSYLRSNDKYYYLVCDKYLMETTVDDLYYSTNIILKRGLDFNEIVEELQSTDQNAIITEIKKLDDHAENFTSRLE
jgi:hypothetical protein